MLKPPLTEYFISPLATIQGNAGDHSYRKNIFTIIDLSNRAKTSLS